MPAQFPPSPVFPNAIDSDYTLFLVYNSTETVITSDNQAWSDEIEIRPQPYYKSEVWPDNGFATISGEMLYYDSVEKNGNDRVSKLKGCIRNLGGSETRFNREGTSIRGFVVAEHHNQIADTIIEIEKFVGTVDCQNTNTLTCCLDELDVPACESDSLCPDVIFTVDTVTNDTCEGLTIEWNVDISGNFNNFRIDFGDGTFTTIPASGTKTYSPGSNIDPVLTIGNNNCEVVITAVERTGDQEPRQATEQEDLTIGIVDFEIPDFQPVNIEIPETDIVLPPLITPCIDLDPINIDIGPISIGDINVPSAIEIIPPSLADISIAIDLPEAISIEAPDLPSTISVIVPSIEPISIIPPSIDPISIIPPILDPISIIPPSIDPISIIPPSIDPISVSIPSISIDPISVIPPSISIDPITIIPPNIDPISIIPPTLSPISIVQNIPTTITLVHNLPDYIELLFNPPDLELIIPSIDPITVDWNNAPSITVDWGSPPTLSCQVSVVCPESTPMMMRALDDVELNDINSAIDDDFNFGSMEVGYDVVGIPSVIKLEVPNISNIKLEHDLPSIIKIESPSLPSVIEVSGMIALPEEIKVLMPSVMPEVKLNTLSLPKSISVDWGDSPRSIEIDGSSIPNEISVKHDIPSIITVEGMVDTIKVEGFPDFIPLRIENPDDLVLKIEPAEVKIKLDIDKILTPGEDNGPCFHLVRCEP